MNSTESDDSGAAGENSKRDAALPQLELHALKDKTQRILDPLIIQPNSEHLEDKELFSFSKTQWGNSEPIKYQWMDHCEKIVATPCDRMGSTTVQTSHSIAAHDVSGIQEPSRGRFITFDGSIPNQISAVLKNIESRELGKPHIIYRDNPDSGDYEKIARHLLGKPFLPVSVTDLPIEIRNLLTKRLKEHDELTPDELKMCIFGPQSKLEKGAYKFVFIFDDDTVKMLYGRALPSKAGKALRPVLNHSHLSGNGNLPAGGNFGFGMDRKTRKEEFTYIDNGSNGYGYPPVQNVKECVKWLLEHEKIEAFQSLDLDEVFTFGDISTFRRKGFSRKASGQGSETATPRSEVGTPSKIVGTPDTIVSTPGSIGGTPALPSLDGYFAALAASSRKSDTLPFSTDNVRSFSEHVAGPPEGLKLQLPASKVRAKLPQAAKDGAFEVGRQPELGEPVHAQSPTEPAQVAEGQRQSSGPAPFAPQHGRGRRFLRVVSKMFPQPATPRLLKILTHAVMNRNEIKETIARPEGFLDRINNARGRQ